MPRMLAEVMRILPATSKRAMAELSIDADYLRMLVRGLDSRKQAELVALMWLGRGDGEPEEWNELVQQALERREVPTEVYLLDHPLLAEHWLEGMERLGLGGLVET
jgi:hypothetical protein